MNPFFAQEMIGIFLIIAGVTLNAARKHDRLREVIEIYVLGGARINEEGTEYAKVVKWIGWPSILFGVLIMVPTSIYWDIGILAIVLWIGFRVRREYQQLKRKTAEDDLTTIANKAPQT